ncbi:tetratricopeptide repeat protein [Patescibacteria group bacterium]|nr:tetratricopeptide repeat protein [Patescibacteria group bacterium]
MKKLLSLLVVSIILLSGCFNSHKIAVDLTDEEIKQIEFDIEVLKYEIEHYTGEGKAALEIVELARAYQKLGELDKAIEVYKDVLSDGYTLSVAHHNLGRLYEDVGEFDLAVEQYQAIIDKFNDLDYLYDITWAYIRAGNRKEAEKYFNAWQLEFRKTDLQTQQAIKKLREEEKENS